MTSHDLGVGERTQRVGVESTDPQLPVVLAGLLKSLVNLALDGVAYLGVNPKSHTYELEEVGGSEETRDVHQLSLLDLAHRSTDAVAVVLQVLVGGVDHVGDARLPACG